MAARRVARPPRQNPSYPWQNQAQELLHIATMENGLALDQLARKRQRDRLSALTRPVARRHPNQITQQSKYPCRAFKVLPGLLQQALEFRSQALYRAAKLR